MRRLQFSFDLENLALIHKQCGFIKGDMIGILIGGVALGGLLLYGSVSGQALPLWPAVIVGLVNVLAAANVVWTVKKAKKAAQERAQASNTNKID